MIGQTLILQPPIRKSPLCCWRDDGVFLITRNSYDFTDRFPSIGAALATLRCRSCIIDGEMVVVDEQGLATFDRLLYGSRVKPEAMLYALT